MRAERLRIKGTTLWRRKAGTTGQEEGAIELKEGATQERPSMRKVRLCRTGEEGAMQHKEGRGDRAQGRGGPV